MSSSNNNHPVQSTEEYKRLVQSYGGKINPWKKWGTYVSDRQWGTVREDYSNTGDAWNFFPFEHAHKRAYRWGEDAIFGLCDRYQFLIFSFAFWNENDPILKERLFGLAPSQGNHGEDVKEYYFHLAATPTYSYVKYLYKYPQKAFPYEQIIKENKKRTLKDQEYELVDTGIFDEDQYFDIFIEYAKASEEDICIKIEVCNRSSKEAPIHIIPQLFFRNRWGWEDNREPQPSINIEEREDLFCLHANDEAMQPLKRVLFSYHLSDRFLFGEKDGEVLFTNNETNCEEVFQSPSISPYTKDAFHKKIIEKKDSVNPRNEGTKGAIHYRYQIPAKSSKTLYFRLTNHHDQNINPLEEVETIIQKRKNECDQYYEALSNPNSSEEEKKIQKQAYAGLIQSKQFYYYDVSVWLVGDSKKNPPPKERSEIRNDHWRHLNSLRILSMPDKWEYPWFAAWDLAFHTVTLALIDLPSAKNQLWYLLFDQFQHPDGQIPAYEWEFSDVNPPIQAWAALKIFQTEKQLFHKEDYAFLERCFHKLLFNFSWWVNIVDPSGKNIFEGGFLGLDNITVIDRSDKKGLEGTLDEADASGWMAMFCLNLMEIALILAKKDKIYESLATKFFEHFIYIGAALRKGYWRNYDMFDQADSFFYSVLHKKDGSFEQLKVRSVVGVIPLFGTCVLQQEDILIHQEFYENFVWFCNARNHLTDFCVHQLSSNGKTYFLFSLLKPEELGNFLGYLLDKDEFLSEYGIRSVSKYHKEHPFQRDGKVVDYEPGEASVNIKGGNSNWRGPIWMPINYIIYEKLKLIDLVLPDLTIKTKKGEISTPAKLASKISKGLISLFQEDGQKIRPIYRDWKKFQTDSNFSSYLLFFEHYHGDSGRGLGASHQTGWSALIANLIHEQ